MGSSGKSINVFIKLPFRSLMHIAPSSCNRSGRWDATGCCSASGMEILGKSNNNVQRFVEQVQKRSLTTDFVTLKNAFPTFFCLFLPLCLVHVSDCQRSYFYYKSVGDSQWNFSNRTRRSRERNEGNKLRNIMTSVVVATVTRVASFSFSFSSSLFFFKVVHQS